MGVSLVSGNYLKVSPVPCHRTGPGRFATEGPFAEHLRLLRRLLPAGTCELVIAAPELPAERYRALAGQFAEIDERKESIRFRPVFPAGIGRFEYWKRLPSVMKAVSEEVRLAHTVHSSASHLYRPFEFPSLWMAKRSNKRTVFVTDIDNRLTPWMLYKTGQWSLREYLWTRIVHMSWHHLQQVYAAKNFSAVLLKGRELASRYGKGRSNVHFFLDSAYSSSDILPADKLQQKVERLASGATPLRAVYFGRLVAYKGVDRMVEAVHLAAELGAKVELRIIGDGPERQRLRDQVRSLSMEGMVRFIDPLPYGPPLFEELFHADVLLAAPLRQDTPRSALDAAAGGIPVVSFDTYYYRDLQEMGAGIALVEWPNTQAMGECIARLAGDRQALSRMAMQSGRFAAQNTQEVWLARRLEWTFGPDYQRQE